jgi:hypothetical protein
MSKDKSRLTLYETACDKAKELGAAEVKQGAILKRNNWTWAMDFPTPDAALQFVAWLDQHGFENGGYNSKFDNSVKFRGNGLTD